jgi:hypothetical protein
MTGYCRIWIPGYTDIASPLYQILKRAQKDSQPFMEWDDKSKKVFHQLKKALMTAQPWVSQYRISFKYMSMKRKVWPWEW